MIKVFVPSLVSGATVRGEEYSGLAAVGVRRHWGAEVVFSLGRRSGEIDCFVFLLGWRAEVGGRLNERSKTEGAAWWSCVVYYRPYSQGKQVRWEYERV